MENQTPLKSQRAPRRPVIILSLVVVLVILISGVLLLVNALQRKTTQAAYNYRLATPTLRIEGIQVGGVVITPGPAGRIRLVQRTTQGIIKTPAHVSLKDNTLYVSQDGCSGWFQIHFLGGCTSNYTIQVPQQTAIMTTTTKANYSIDGVNGNHTIQTTAGTVAIKNVSAQSLFIKSSSGNLHLQHITARHTLRAISNSGSITGTAVTAQSAIASSQTAPISISQLSSDSNNVTTKSAAIYLQFTTPPARLITSTDSADTAIKLPPGTAAYRTAVHSVTGHSTVSVLNVLRRGTGNGHNSITAHSQSGNITIGY